MYSQRYPDIQNQPYKRPWSPEPFDPNTYNAPGPSRPFDRRREASEASVEALDLADYAHHLRAPRQSYYPVHNDDVVPGALLPSRRGTSTKPSIASTSRGKRQQPHRRPFSLPPASVHPRSLPEDLEEAAIDISSFPAWSQGWYNPARPPPRSCDPPDAATTSWPSYDEPPPAPYSPFSPKNQRSPFDPAYTHQMGGFDPYDDPPSVDGYKYAYGYNSSVPSLPPSYGSPLNADQKAERLRMLEAEFGSKKMPGFENDEEDATEEIIRVGAVTPSGRIMSSGPKRRRTLRIMQFLFLIATGAASLYCLMLIHPTVSPPPRNTLPSYLFPVLAILCFVGYTYFLLVRPRSHNKPESGSIPGYEAMPITLPGQNGKGKKNKKGGIAPINLTLLLPALQQQQQPQSDRSDDGMVERRRARPTLPEMLALEHTWRLARRTLHLLAWYDAASGIIWGAVFVLVLIGPRCNSIPEYDGWCTAYNGSTAGAALLMFSCILAIYWDIVDLYTSRQSPRTGA